MRAVRAAVALAVAVSGAAVTHSGVQAYASYSRWPTNTVTFLVNPVNSDVSQAAAVAALQAGMDVWNTQAGTPFRYQYGGLATDTATAYDNRNVVLFRNATNGSAIASTYSWWSSNNELVDSDIVFWDAGFTFFTGSSGCGVVSNAAYMEDIAAHEFGHALGLSHSTVTTATMYPSYSYCSMQNRTLDADDIAGAQTLYPGAATNTAPTVTVSSPGSVTTFTGGALITFTGTATDTQDGVLTPALAWNSNIDGAIGLGGSFTRTLSAGAHTVTATATDAGGLKTVKQISVTVGATNTAPAVTIVSPIGGASFASGAAVTFTGTATDVQDGTISSRLAWTSSLDGAIGTGASFSRVLKAGTHTIRATVTDAGGMTTARALTITVASAATNTAPAVTITSPASGASFASGATVSFSGTATDTQDGSLTGALSWRSSLDGALGTGGTLTRALTVGTHAITATVTDRGGLTTTRQVTVTVNAPATGTLTTNGRRTKTSSMVDLTWSGLSGASLDVYRNSSKLSTTANDGAETDTIVKKGGGTYTYKVCLAGTATCSNSSSVTF